MAVVQARVDQVPVPALVHQADSAAVQVDAADVAAAPLVHSAVQVAHHVVVRSRSVRRGMNTKSYAHQM